MKDPLSNVTLRHFYTTDVTMICVTSTPSCPTETLQGSDYLLYFGMFAETSIVKFSLNVALSKICLRFDIVLISCHNVVIYCVDLPDLLITTSSMCFHHTMPSQASIVLHSVGSTILPPFSSPPKLLCKSVDASDLLATMSPLRLHHDMTSQASTVLHKVGPTILHPFLGRRNYCARERTRQF